MNSMSIRLSVRPGESKDHLMDLVAETFDLLADNIELYNENKRLKARVKSLETFIRGMGKNYN